MAEKMAVPVDERREGICELCEIVYAAWLTTNELWQAVSQQGLMRFACPTCFVNEAHRIGFASPFLISDGKEAVYSHAFVQMLVAELDKLRAALLTENPSVSPQKSPLRDT